MATEVSRSIVISRVQIILLCTTFIGCFPPALEGADEASGDHPNDGLEETDELAADLIGDSNIGACSTDCSELDGPCGRGRCNLGSCVSEPEVGACDDGLACTTDDRCVEGVCVGGRPITCDDSPLPCIENRCDPVDGQCRAFAKPGGTPCSDGDACTFESCSEGPLAGTCETQGQTSCPPPSDCHIEGTCNSLSGSCAEALKPSGSPCTSAIDWSGQTDQPGTCHEGTCRRLPRIAVGTNHSCAVYWNGTLKCWGNNDHGQLGIGSTQSYGADMTHPVDSVPVAATGVEDAVAGVQATCATFEDGLRCWGLSENCYTLGTQTCVRYGSTDATRPAAIPTVVLGTHSDGSPVRAHRVTLSWERGCIVSDRGTLRCWGFEDEGWPFAYQGTEVVNGPLSPSLADLGDMSLAAAGSVFPVSRIAIGKNGDCAISSRGDVRCWGGGTSLGFDPGGLGQLGDDEPIWSGPAINDGWLGSEICMSGSDFAHALDELGRVWAWGDGLETSGIAPPPDSRSPRLLDVGLPLAEVGCGDDFACGRTKSGVVLCWGRGQGGQLGLGERLDRPPAFAQPVSLPSPVYDLAVGAGHSCVVTLDGEVRCWGSNGGGQLGIGSTDAFGDDESEKTPRAIDFGTGIAPRP